MGKKPQPADGDLLIGPGVGPIGIGPEDRVDVVGHHRVPRDVDGEDVSEVTKPLLDPELAMVAVIATEERTADTSADAVVEPCRLMIDEETSWDGHGGPPPTPGPVISAVAHRESRAHLYSRNRKSRGAKMWVSQAKR
jgi:hypothetical protein